MKKKMKFIKKIREIRIKVQNHYRKMPKAEES